MKRIVSFVLVISLLMSVSAFAFADNGGEPTATQIMAAAPADFHFDHTETGSVRVDTFIESAVPNTVCFLFGAIPGAGAASFVISIGQNLVNFYSSSPAIDGWYIKYVYVPNNRADYPACDSWVYVEYYADANRDSASELIGTNSYYVPIVLPK